ncbi:MAG: baseplate J/gp47 family protein [Deltaproteobacteria bacterium]|jgi:uncharacterized phage protein gp47/JayE|nr:baseplate J/gp47 family protein [Deltaproteobacteria bacterium]
MSWTSPTLKELIETCGGELSARLLDGAPLKPRSVLSVLATTRAGGEHLMHMYLAWAFRQVFPDKAETEYLDAWAGVWGVTRKPGRQAAGLVMATGNPGAGLPEDALARSGAGTVYRLGGATLPDGTGTVQAELAAEAVEPGLAGNLAAGMKLSLTSPAAGVGSELTVTGDGLAGGTDDEDDEALRSRLLQAIREPPSGGNKADYEVWARQVSGVENALCIPLYAGLGTVAVAVWGKPEDPALPGVTVEDAYRHILALCPVTAGPGLHVFTPDILAVDFMIRLVPDTQAVRDNVSRELADLFRREAVPGRPIPLSHFQEAISLAAGEYDHELLGPQAAVEPGMTWLPALGQIGFQGE